MLLLVPLLFGLVVRQTGDDAADGALNTVANTGGEVADLPSGLLFLAFAILLSTLFLELLHNPGC